MSLYILDDVHLKQGNAIWSRQHCTQALRIDERLGVESLLKENALALAEVAHRAATSAKQGVASDAP